MIVVSPRGWIPAADAEIHTLSAETSDLAQAFLLKPRVGQHIALYTSPATATVMSFHFPPQFPLHSTSFFFQILFLQTQVDVWHNDEPDFWLWWGTVFPPRRLFVIWWLVFYHDTSSQFPDMTGCAALSHPSSCMLVNYGPSQQSCKEEYKPWKWCDAARYYASHKKKALRKNCYQRGSPYQDPASD